MFLSLATSNFSSVSLEGNILAVIAELWVDVKTFPVWDVAEDFLILFIKTFKIKKKVRHTSLLFFKINAQHHFGSGRNPLHYEILRAD